MTEIQQRISTSFSRQALTETFGARLTLVAHGEVRITLPFSRHLSQQHGFMHAGAITSVVDSEQAYKVIALMQATIANIPQ